MDMGNSGECSQSRKPQGHQCSFERKIQQPSYILVEKDKGDNVREKSYLLKIYSIRKRLLISNKVWV